MYLVDFDSSAPDVTAGQRYTYLIDETYAVHTLQLEL